MKINARLLHIDLSCSVSTRTAIFFQLKNINSMRNLKTYSRHACKHLKPVTITLEDMSRNANKLRAPRKNIKGDMIGV